MAVNSPSSAVHPRWRGEHSPSVRRLGGRHGSSPLARGTPHAAAYHFKQRRFIPAGAGNTCLLCPAGYRLAVHPRWRGEHKEWRKFCKKGVWFIPAGAGNTSRLGIAIMTTPVHPRWRGEHTSGNVDNGFADGSSPLARGTQVLEGGQGLGLRFIPAGAGNTRRFRRCPRRHPVHPRWRGEHARHPAAKPPGAGSSPLARGTRSLSALFSWAVRFIPAGAGNTTVDVVMIDRTVVHPRWRGEHGIETVSQDRDGGSSPLARGTPLTVPARPDTSRFIPAGAGNTSRSRGDAKPPAVHPRWRGEHFDPWRPHQSRGGSSPLARGTHLA